MLYMDGKMFLQKVCFVIVYDEMAYENMKKNEKLVFHSALKKNQSL